MKNNKAQSLNILPPKPLDIVKPSLFFAFQHCCLAIYHIQGCLLVLLAGRILSLPKSLRQKAKPPVEGGFVKSHVLQPVLSSYTAVRRNPCYRRTAAGKE
jgi:hypothetical protein